MLSGFGLVDDVAKIVCVARGFVVVGLLATLFLAAALVTVSRLVKVGSMNHCTAPRQSDATSVGERGRLTRGGRVHDGTGTALVLHQNTHRFLHLG